MFQLHLVKNNSTSTDEFNLIFLLNATNCFSIIYELKLAKHYLIDKFDKLMNFQFLLLNQTFNCNGLYPLDIRSCQNIIRISRSIVILNLIFFNSHN